LRPLAGDLTFFLFAAGIIGTGLLAVPVLAGSAAYAVAETFGFHGSLELPVSRAIGFYALISAATFVGALLAVTRIDPILMLFWAAVINGIVAVPIMVAMMLVIRKGRGMGSLTIPRWLRGLGWAGAALMALTVVGLIWSSL
jgi:Mn2+/Fe2+ NRAMP family transporter